MDGRLIIANKRLEAHEKGVSINPATGKPLGEFDLASASQCGRAVSAAREAAESWSLTSWKTKKEIFLKAKEILLSRREEAAQRITGEKGSPILESMAEEVTSARRDAPRQEAVPDLREGLAEPVQRAGDLV